MTSMLAITSEGGATDDEWPLAGDDREQRMVGGIDDLMAEEVVAGGTRSVPSGVSPSTTTYTAYSSWPSACVAFGKTAWTPRAPLMLLIV